jgi:plasmid stabilization system protein ParE
LILFRVLSAETPKVVEVLRVLHDAMDLVRHLPGAASGEEEAT